MIAEYNHWYKCQEGQMPEDFENIPTFCDGDVTENVTVWYELDSHIGSAHRRYIYSEEENWHWEWNTYRDDSILAWMLPESYKER